MLQEISIENLAVIKKASIPLGQHLNVFTGETGAGKSIMLGGIQAILGQRVTRDIVRTGAEKAIVTALFTDLSETILHILNENGISSDKSELYSDGGQLVISREIHSDGRSVARVNGRVSSVGLLKELGEHLVNIHGQHDSQALLSPEKHLPILDSFGGLDAQREVYQGEFKRLQDMAKRIHHLSNQQKELINKKSALEEQVAEITTAAIIENEDKTLEQRYLLAQNSGNLQEALQECDVFLAGSDENDFLGACNLVNKAVAVLDSLDDEMLNKELLPLRARLSSLAIDLEDISQEISDVVSEIDHEPGELERLEERKAELSRLKRRYGPELQDVITSCEVATSQLQQLGDFSQKLEYMLVEKQQLLSQVTELAKELSSARKKAANRLKSLVEEQLAFLDMPNVKMDIQINHGKLTLAGMDSVEFFLSANLGEPPKQLAKIASGGELSRIMLAIKNVIAGQDDVPTLIFDEIDTGVSGRAAQKIGIKLAQISQLRQVICVTHLAQIAIQANEHLFIEKCETMGATETSVHKLDFDGQKREIARILGGDNVTDLLLENAAQMLGSKWKA